MTDTRARIRRLLLCRSALLHERDLVEAVPMLSLERLPGNPHVVAARKKRERAQHEHARRLSLLHRRHVAEEASEQQALPAESRSVVERTWRGHTVPVADVR